MADNSNIKIKLEITNIDQVRQQLKSLGGTINLGGGGNNSSGGNNSGGSGSNQVPGGKFVGTPGSVNLGVGKFTSANLGIDLALLGLDKFKDALFAIINPLKEASKAAYKFEASIVATVGTLQATTRIVDPRGIQVEPGAQLREQFRIATGLEKAGRGSLAPIGVGGAEQSLLTNTFIQAQTTKTGVAVSEQDLKTTLPRLVAAIKVLAPNLGETREAKELRDIVLNQRVGQITAGPGIRALAPDLAKARTAQEFEEATRPLEAYITALKEGNTPLAARLKLEGQFHIIQQDAGEAFNQALLPALKDLTSTLENPKLSEGLQTLAAGIGTLVSDIIIEANRITKEIARFSNKTDRNNKNYLNLLADEAADNPFSRAIIANSPFLFPGGQDAILARDKEEQDLKVSQFKNQQIRDKKLNPAFLKGEEDKKLQAENTPEGKFTTLLSGLQLNAEKFNKTTSSDLSDLGNDPNVQIFQGRQLLKGIPSLGLDDESANERSLGALRLVAGGQEKNQSIGGRNFASNLPGQLAKTQFDIKSFGDRISTQRQIVANRQEAVQNETDPLKKGILEGELRTEIDKLKEDLKGFGDSLKEAEAQPLKVAKAFADLALTVQQLNHLQLRQAIQTGAADDAVKAAKRDRDNFAAEGPLRNLQRQSSFVSAAQKFGEAGGLGFQGGPSGFAGVAAQEAATKGLQSFKDSLEAAKKAVDDFKDGFQERQDNRDTDVFNAQKALDAANNGPSGDTGEEQDQHQRDIRAAERALDKARQANINGFSDDDKEQSKLQGNIPSFFAKYLNSNLAGAELAKSATTVAQGGEVDAEGLRGKNRALATAGLDQLELSAKQAAESVGLLNNQLAQLQALGLTPASRAADNAAASVDNDNTPTGLAGGILKQQRDLNKRYLPTGVTPLYGPFKSDASGSTDGNPPPPPSTGLFDEMLDRLSLNPKTPATNPPKTGLGGDIDDVLKQQKQVDYSAQPTIGKKLVDILDKTGVGKENPGPAIGQGLGDIFNTWKSAFSKTNPLTDAGNFINDAGKEWQKADEENKAQEKAWDKALNGPARNLMEMKQLAKSLGATDDDFQKAVAVPSTGQILGPQYAGPIETLSGQQERASIAAGLFAGVSGAGFEGTDGKTSARGAHQAADIADALGARDANLAHFKKTAAKMKQSAFGEDNIFNTDAPGGKPLTKQENTDSIYEALNRHFN